MSAVAAFSPQPHRLTVTDYYRMAEAGIFKEDDRVELIEGEIFDMSPRGADHTSLVNRLNSIFAQCVGLQAIVSVQNPISLNLRSEPQPDLALLRRFTAARRKTPTWKNTARHEARPSPRKV